MTTKPERDASLATPTSKSAADPDTDAIPPTLGADGFTAPQPVDGDTSD